MSHARTAAAALAATLLLSTPAPGEDAPADEGRLTVERILSDPAPGGTLPRDARFSPDGESLTYLEPEEEGASPSLWRYRIADRQRAVLIAADDLPGDSEGGRLSMSAHHWSPTGEDLVIEAGGDLFAFRVERGRLRRLTDTEDAESDPKISPNGRWVAFVRGHNLHAVPLRREGEVALTEEGEDDVLLGEPDWVTCEELDLCSAYWWSPDSTRLALLRFDQARVFRYPIVDWLPVHAEVTWEYYPKAGDRNADVSLGVVGLEDRSVRWLRTGAGPDDYLARVTWTPDAAALLVQRLNRAQDRVELVRVDASGEAAPQVLLREEDEHWINIADDMRVLSDGRFVWGSERDGWRHLYLHAADGKLERRLTRGEWVVTDLVGVDEEEAAVWFLSTRRSPMERQLDRVGLEGGDIARVSAEDGTHTVTLAPGGDYYLDRHSRTGVPPGLFLRTADGDLIEDLAPGSRSGIAGYALPRNERFTVKASDGTALPAELFYPPNFDAGRRYPVLIYVYGGPYAQVVRDRWGGSRYLWHAMMAQHGYLIFSLDNRGSGARGHAWETAIDRRFGRQELEDQLAGVAYLRSLPYVDGDRLGIWGWSYGGYMTLFALANAPGIFRAGFSGAPVTDWRLYDTIYTERYMEMPEDNPDGYRDASPVNQAGDLQETLLLVHGTGDDNVHVQNSLAIVQAFVAHNVPHEFRLYPRQRHRFQDREARLDLYHTMTRFFLDNL